MTRSEILKIIETAIERSLGVEPDTGEVLYPHSSYLAHSVLDAIEENGLEFDWEPEEQYPKSGAI